MIGSLAWLAEARPLWEAAGAKATGLTMRRTDAERVAAASGLTLDQYVIGVRMLGITPTFSDRVNAGDFLLHDKA
jgi:hypothetical protein